MCVLLTLATLAGAENLPEDAISDLTCTYTRGETVNASIRVKATPGTYRYRVYIPKGYNDPAHAAMKYPCLFICAGGGNPNLQTMSDWVKHHRWLAVMVSDAKNGPWEPIFGALLGTHDDAMKRLRIQDGLKFATGFSGGARMTGHGVGMRRGFVGCIMHCQYAHESRARDIRGIAWVGLYGAQDKLVPLSSVPHADRQYSRCLWRYEIHGGGHAWAPRELTERALDWVASQAYGRARLTREQALHRALPDIEAFRSADSAGQRCVHASRALPLAMKYRLAGDELDATLASMKQLLASPAGKAELVAWRSFLKARDAEIDVRNANFLRKASESSAKAALARVARSYDAIATRYRNTEYGYESAVRSAELRGVAPPPRPAGTGETAAVKTPTEPERTTPAPAPKLDPATGWTDLFDGKSLTGWRVADTPGHGEVAVQDGILLLAEGTGNTGIAWDGEFPKDDYEVEVAMTRRTGVESMDITLPVGGHFPRVMAGGSHNTVLGFVAGSRKKGKEVDRAFANGQWYVLRVRVARGGVRVWVDGELALDCSTDGGTGDGGANFAPLRPFGLSSYKAASSIRSVRMRRVGDGAAVTPPAAPEAAPAPAPEPTPAADSGEAYRTAIATLAPLWKKMAFAEAATKAEALAQTAELAAAPASARDLVADAKALADFWAAVQEGLPDLKPGTKVRTLSISGVVQKVENGRVQLKAGPMQLSLKLTELHDEELLRLVKAARQLQQSDYTALVLMRLHAGRRNRRAVGEALERAERLGAATIRRRRFLEW